MNKRKDNSGQTAWYKSFYRYRFLFLSFQLHSIHPNTLHFFFWFCFTISFIYFYCGFIYCFTFVFLFVFLSYDVLFFKPMRSHIREKWCPPPVHTPRVIKRFFLRQRVRFQSVFILFLFIIPVSFHIFS